MDTYDTIIEWFDPNNAEHIKAYHHLENSGAWPQDFIPEFNNKFFPTGWHIMLQTKILDHFFKANEAYHKALIDILNESATELSPVTNRIYRLAFNVMREYGGVK
jgi:hypothetical protein